MLERALNLLNRFRSQLLILTTGTFAANAVSLAALPLLTRVYGPAEFGLFAVFFAIASLAGVLSTLRLEFAITLPKDDDEASRLTTLALGVCAMFSLLAGLFLRLLVRLWDYPHVREPQFLLATVAAIFLGGAIMILTYVNIRTENYACLTFRHIGDRLGATLASLILGAFGFKTYGLISGQLFGQALCFAILIHGGMRGRRLLSFSSLGEFMKLAHRYRDFPTRNSISNVLQLAAVQLPPLIYARFFSAAEIGVFSLAQRLMDAGFTVISSSVTTIYYRKLAQSSTKEIETYFRHTFWPSAAILGVAMAVGILAAQYILPPLLGTSWIETSLFLALLSPLYFGRILFSFQAGILVVFRRLDLDLLISLAILLLLTAGVGLGLLTGSGLAWAVAWASATGGIGYLGGLGVLYRVMKRLALPAENKPTG